MTAASISNTPAPALSVLARVQSVPALWPVSRLMATADRRLAEAARSNAAAALQAEDTRRAAWLAEADDWHRAQEIRLP